MRTTLCVLFVAACGSNPTPALNDMASPPDLWRPPTFAEQLVISAVTLPVNRAQYAVDVDGDGKPEDQFGGVVGFLKTAGFNLQTNIDSTIAVGDGLNLLSLASIDKTFMMDNGAQLTMYTALAQNPPDFTGSGTFAIDKTVPKGVLNGDLENSYFLSLDPLSIPSPATVYIHLVLAHLQNMTPVAINMPLVGARIQLTNQGMGMWQGQLNGGLHQTDIDTILIPGLTMALDETEQEPGCPMECQQVKAQFDTNMDGHVTLEEVRNNILVQTLLKPDVQLFDMNGKWHPTVGAPNADSISIGVGFNAVGASFPE